MITCPVAGLFRACIAVSGGGPTAFDLCFKSPFNDTDQREALCRAALAHVLGVQEAHDFLISGDVGAAALIESMRLFCNPTLLALAQHPSVIVYSFNEVSCTTSANALTTCLFSLLFICYFLSVVF